MERGNSCPHGSLELSGADGSGWAFGGDEQKVGRGIVVGNRDLGWECWTMMEVLMEIAQRAFFRRVAAVFLPLSQARFRLLQGPLSIVATSFLYRRKALKHCHKKHFYAIFGEGLLKLWYVPQFRHSEEKNTFGFPKKHVQGHYF